MLRPWLKELHWAFVYFHNYFKVIAPLTSGLSSRARSTWDIYCIALRCIGLFQMGNIEGSGRTEKNFPRGQVGFCHGPYSKKNKNEVVRCKWGPLWTSRTIWRYLPSGCKETWRGEEEIGKRPFSLRWPEIRKYHLVSAKTGNRRKTKEEDNTFLTTTETSLFCSSAKKGFNSLCGSKW